jgi:hypothetical protein
MKIMPLSDNTQICFISAYIPPFSEFGDNCRIMSMISSNGTNWSSSSIINECYSSWPEEFQAVMLNGQLYCMSPASSFISMYTISCPIFKYDADQNRWSNVWNGTSLGGNHQNFFSDSDHLYFSYDLLPGETLRSTDGVIWESIGNIYVQDADAANSVIISSEQSYSPGQGWDELGNPNYYMGNIKFNGNRIVGVLYNGYGQPTNSLCYSDDFGQTWNETFIGEINSASIIEADQKYVALISTSTNSSLYTLDAYPERATVTEIQGFGTTPAGLNFQSTSNGLYQLECTASLINPDWQAYGLPKVGTGGEITIDPSKNLPANRFFRVRVINN